jgi:hypothetical protein
LDFSGLIAMISLPAAMTIAIIAAVCASMTNRVGVPLA